MEEKSMTRNHGGGIIGRGVIEKESLRREASGRHLGGIWEASGKHLALQEAMGLQEAPNHKNRCPSRLEDKSFINILILHCVCKDQITKYCKLQAKMLAGSVNGACNQPWPLDDTVRTPTETRSGQEPESNQSPKQVRPYK